MLNNNEIKYILEHIENDGSEECETIVKKLSILSKQMDLQEEFRNKSIELQNELKAIDNN